MASAKPGYLDRFLTPADAFYEITRGKPYELDGEARKKAGLSFSCCSGVLGPG